MSEQAATDGEHAAIEIMGPVIRIDFSRITQRRFIVSYNGFGISVLACEPDTVLVLPPAEGRVR